MSSFYLSRWCLPFAANARPNRLKWSELAPEYWMRNNGAMKLGLINSTFQQVGVDTATGLRHISRIGFETVDIFTEAIGIPQREVRLVGNLTAKLGLPIISLPV